MIPIMGGESTHNRGVIPTTEEKYSQVGVGAGSATTLADITVALNVSEIYKTLY